MNALCLRLCWIRVCTELEIMICSKLLTNIHHGLQTHSTRIQKNYVISMYPEAQIVTPNAAAQLRIPEKSSKLIHIDAKQYWKGH